MKNALETVLNIIIVHQKYLKNKMSDDEDSDADSDSQNYEVFETEIDESNLDIQPLETEMDTTQDLVASSEARPKSFANNMELRVPGLAFGPDTNIATSQSGVFSKNRDVGFALDLTKARELQEDMAKRMMDKLNREKQKNKSRLEKAEIIQERYDKLDKEHTRILKMLNLEMEKNVVLEADNKRLRNINQELVDINTVVVEANKKIEVRRRALEKNVLQFRRAYMAFNFFLREIKDLEEQGRLLPGKSLSKEGGRFLKFLDVLAQEYDPLADYEEMIDEFEAELAKRAQKTAGQGFLEGDQDAVQERDEERLGSQDSNGSYVLTKKEN